MVKAKKIPSDYTVCLRNGEKSVGLRQNLAETELKCGLLHSE